MTSAITGRQIIQEGADGNKTVIVPERFYLGVRESEPTLCPPPVAGSLLEWAGVSQCFNELTQVPHDLSAALTSMQLPTAAAILAHAQGSSTGRGCAPGRARWMTSL